MQVRLNGTGGVLWRESWRELGYESDFIAFKLSRMLNIDH